MNFASTGDIKCNLMKTPLSMEENEHMTVSKIACEDIALPVDSINYGYGQKCKTYFSRSKGKDPFDFMVRRKNALVGGNGGDIVDFEIEFPSQYGVDDSSGVETRSALLMLHSPYEMPDWSDRVSKIKPAMEYVVSFNKITEMKMPPPYRTDCSNYDGDVMGQDGVSFRSRYDCVDDCLMNLFRQGCRCLPANMNIRREMLYSGDRFCDDKRCFSLASSEAKACRSLPSCRPNCVQVSFKRF